MSVFSFTLDQNFLSGTRDIYPGKKIKMLFRYVGMGLEKLRSSWS